MSTQQWAETVRDSADNHNGEGRKFGQSYEGEKVPFMKVMAPPAKAQHGDCLKLECPECDTMFWCQLWKTGQNTVIRGELEEVHAQCPGCGAEWNGKKTQYFAIYRQRLTEGPIPGTAVAMMDPEPLAVVQARTACEAPGVAINAGLITRQTMEDDNASTLFIQEVPTDYFRLYEIHRKVMQAKDAEDPDLVAIMVQAMADQHSIMQKRRKRKPPPANENIVELFRRYAESATE